MPAAHDHLPARHLHGFDLLRFAAALLVVLNHFATYAVNTPMVTRDVAGRAWPQLAPLAGTGAVGVQIFFVISGYVIALSAADRSGLRGALGFARARAWRILPALWMSGAISVVALLLTGADLAPLLARFLRSALLLPVGPYIDGVVWSLVVEAVFYALIALAILCCPRPPLLRIALGLGAISAVHLGLLVWTTAYGPPQIAALLSRFPFKLLLLQHGVFFAIGMILHVASRDGITAPVRAALGVFALFGLAEIALQSGLRWPAAGAAILIWLAAMGFFLWSQRGALPVRWHAGLRLLGDLSYPLYLNHYTTGMAVTVLLHRAGLSGAAAFWLALVIVLLISLAVLRAEQGLRRHRTARRPARPPRIP